MSAYVYLAIHDAAAFGAGAYLVSHDCPWWGALCFFAALTTNITRST